MKEYPETHQHGTISMESMPEKLHYTHLMRGDFGIQIAEDGRIRVCIDGVAFIRFSPHADGKMRKEKAQ